MVSGRYAFVVYTAAADVGIVDGIISQPILGSAPGDVPDLARGQDR